MSRECCGPDEPEETVDDCCAAPGGHAHGEQEEMPVWWRDPALRLPAVSGVLLAVGYGLEWSGLDVAAIVVFAGGLAAGAWTFVPGALRRLRRGRTGVGLLMTIAAVGAVLLGHVGEAAALAFLFSIAEALEDRAMDKARHGLRALLSLMPETARLSRLTGDVTVPAAEVRAHDILVVGAGERIATDGVVTRGRSSVDTSAVTGESIPVEVGPGDPVPAGAVNGAGRLHLEATADGRDNSLTTIVRLVEEAHARKGERARLADRIARPLVPVVLVAAALVAAYGFLAGDPGTWIERALVVLVAASPCAMAIAVPVTVISAIGAASRLGVVIKSGDAFERLGTIRTVALDKTGTLTRNHPEVVSVEPAPGFTRDEILTVAAGLESASTHPLAAAIIAAASSTPARAASARALAAPAPVVPARAASTPARPARDAAGACASAGPVAALPAHGGSVPGRSVGGAAPVADVEELAGLGVTGVWLGRPVRAGSPRWIDAGPLAGTVDTMADQGMSVILVEIGGVVAGAIGVRDELRPEAAEAVAALRAQGIEVMMLTGDNTRTAHALARQAGITDVRAEQLPPDKAAAVEAADAHAPTAMIGDGINDAPALAAASVGIAMGATGSAAAVESAGVAFTGTDLRLIPEALAHARRGRRIMTGNIGLALAIIVVLFPLALFGVLGLAQVVLVHELAEVVVILNGVRAARRPGGVPSRAWRR
ncbi:heavy metal translocating P-type ATPase [Actinoplanes sp. CA-131856]